MSIDLKKLYHELQERLQHLEAQPPTDERNARIAELVLVIVRVQQLLLEKLKNNYVRCKDSDLNG